MPKVIIDQEKCKGCLLCISFCPKGLIRAGKQLNHKGIPAVVFQDKGECLGCSLCAVICPDWCIRVQR